MPGSHISWIIHGIAAMLLVGWHHSVLKQHINQTLKIVQDIDFQSLTSLLQWPRYSMLDNGGETASWWASVVPVQNHLHYRQISFFVQGGNDLSCWLCMTLEMTSLCIIHRHLASVTIANAIITLVVSLHCGIDFSKQTPLVFLQQIRTNVFVMIMYYVYHGHCNVECHQNILYLYGINCRNRNSVYYILLSHGEFSYLKRMYYILLVYEFSGSRTPLSYRNMFSFSWIF